MTVNEMYSVLMSKDGKLCRTLSQGKPAVMHVEPRQITIEYDTGNTTTLPRDMVDEAITKLMAQGFLSLEDVHEGITKRRGARTDRLMAVLRELPGVTFKSSPRELYFAAPDDA